MQHSIVIPAVIDGVHYRIRVTSVGLDGVDYQIYDADNHRVPWMRLSPQDENYLTRSVLLLAFGCLEDSAVRPAATQLLKR